MKKILLSIGTVATIATPIIAVVSCGSTQKVANHSEEAAESSVSFVGGGDGVNGLAEGHGGVYIYNDDFSYDDYKNNELLPIVKHIVKKMVSFKHYDFGTTFTSYDNTAMVADYIKYMFGSLNLLNNSMWNGSFRFRKLDLLSTGGNFLSQDVFDKSADESFVGEQLQNFKNILSHGHTFIWMFKNIIHHADEIDSQGLINFFNNLNKNIEQKIFRLASNAPRVGVISNWNQYRSSILYRSDDNVFVRTFNEVQRVKVFKLEDYQYSIVHDNRRTGYESYSVFIDGVKSFNNMEDMVELLRKFSDNESISKLVNLIEVDHVSAKRAKEIKDSLLNYLFNNSVPPVLSNDETTKNRMFNAFHNHYSRLLGEWNSPWYRKLADAQSFDSTSLFEMYEFTPEQFYEYVDSPRYKDLYEQFVQNPITGSNRQGYFALDRKDDLVTMDYVDLKRMLTNYSNVINQHLYRATIKCMVSMGYARRYEFTKHEIERVLHNNISRIEDADRVAIQTMLREIDFDQFDVYE